jgi:hypothetical protein
VAVGKAIMPGEQRREDEDRSSHKREDEGQDEEEVALSASDRASGVQEAKAKHAASSEAEHRRRGDGPHESLKRPTPKMA